MLSNDRYSVFLTAAGSGYSAVDGIDVTRWREDATCDCWGQYCYIRDLHDGRFWSAGRQPTGRVADEYQAELRKMIDAKVAGEDIVAPAEEEAPKVVNLMEALRQSLERVSTTKKRTAKADAKPAKVVERMVPKKRARG